jgi:hypothetical protein
MLLSWFVSLVPAVVRMATDSGLGVQHCADLWHVRLPAYSIVVWPFGGHHLFWWGGVCDDPGPTPCVSGGLLLFALLPTTKCLTI